MFVLLDMYCKLNGSLSLSHSLILSLSHVLLTPLIFQIVAKSEHNIKIKY